MFVTTNHRVDFADNVERLFEVVTKWTEARYGIYRHNSTSVRNAAARLEDQVKKLRRCVNDDQSDNREQVLNEIAVSFERFIDLCVRLDVKPQQLVQATLTTVRSDYDQFIQSTKEPTDEPTDRGS